MDLTVWYFGFTGYMLPRKPDPKRLSIIVEESLPGLSEAPTIAIDRGLKKKSSSLPCINTLQELRIHRLFAGKRD
jgi:hypothetical protein